MSRIIVGDTVLECCVGDIASQADLDAVVNASNAELRIGGGVAGALHRAAGQGLEAECRPLAPIRPGQAVITGAHGLPNRRVVHVLGPVYGHDEPAAQLLSACYRNALRLAEEHSIRSIGFPSISTGAFGYPMEEAAAIALGACGDEIPRLQAVKLIRFVLHDQRALDIHADALQGVIQESRDSPGRDSPRAAPRAD